MDLRGMISKNKKAMLRFCVKEKNNKSAWMAGSSETSGVDSDA